MGHRPTARRRLPRGPHGRIDNGVVVREEVAAAAAETPGLDGVALAPLAPSAQVLDFVRQSSASLYLPELAVEPDPRLPVVHTTPPWMALTTGQVRNRTTSLLSALVGAVRSCVITVHCPCLGGRPPWLVTAERRRSRRPCPWCRRAARELQPSGHAPVLARGWVRTSRTWWP